MMVQLVVCMDAVSIDVSSNFCNEPELSVNEKHRDKTIAG